MNWKNIWSSRNLKSIENLSAQEILQSLLEMDGFDSPTGSIHVEAWSDYIEYLCTLLGLTETDSIFEVGCGAGAFIYSFFKNNHTVSGLDFSNDLISIAQRAMPGMNFETTEALELDYSKKFDHVIASSVVFYFPSYDYTNEVLTRMLRKALKTVVILDVPDLATKDECEQFRQGTMTKSEYNRKYKDLQHLYFPKQFWIKLAERNNLSCHIEQQYIEGYCNNEYRYNVVFRRLNQQL